MDSASWDFLIALSPPAGNTGQSHNRQARLLGAHKTAMNDRHESEPKVLLDNSSGIEIILFASRK